MQAPRKLTLKAMFGCWNLVFENPRWLGTIPKIVD